jgi:two-component system KDP operon response regulator KdpE
MRPVSQDILVVDDEAPMRKYVGMNLKARGYGVLLAADGTEALDQVARNHIDLLILDVGLPGCDGLSVLSQVRRDLTLPVLMVSARACEVDKARALDLGADDYLVKPFGVDELLTRVGALLQESSPPRPLPGGPPAALR